MVQKKIPSINSAHGSETRNIINEIIKAINDRGLEILSESGFLTWLEKNGIKHREEVATFDDLPSGDSLNTVRGVLDDNKIYIKKENGWVPFQTIDINKINLVESNLEGVTIVASQYGAIGDGIADDTLALQKSIDQANGNVITLKANGTYVISNTLKLKEDTKFNGNNSTIILNSNKDGFLVPNNAVLTGVNIRAGIDNYSNFMIKLDDKSGYNVASKGYIKDVSFYGGSEMKSKGIGSHDDGTRGVVSYHKGENLQFNRMQNGFYFVNTHNSSWYNGNMYSNITMYHCENFITLLGTCDGNVFKNVQLQPSGAIITGIRCNGNNNKFDVTSWDYNAYPEAIPYDFTAGSYNEVNTNLTSINHNLYKGMNSTNKLNSSNINNLVVPKANTEGTSIITKSGTLVPVYENFNGNQDDVFTFADKHSTITTTGPDINNGYAIRNVFRNNRFAPRWSLNSNEEVKIKIVGTYNYLDVFGLLFTQNFPDYLIIKYKTHTGSVREIKFDYISNPAVYTNEIIGSTSTEIEITFGVRESKSVRLSRIFGSSRYMSQTTFVETGGGNMYGDLTLHEGTLRLNSPDGSLFRLNVANDGTLSTTKI